MSRLVRALLVALVLTIAAAGDGHARGWRSRYATTSSYYYYPTWVSSYYPTVWAMPLQYEYQQPVEACPAPAYQAPAPQQAAPAPAGPSPRPIIPRSSEPPRTNQKPAVTESRSYYDAYGVVGGQTNGDGLHTVGFWNLSDRDVTLTVDNRQVQVPRGRSVRMQLPRGFVWRVDNREAKRQTIPERDSALEIVIRH